MDLPSGAALPLLRALSLSLGAAVVALALAPALPPLVDIDIGGDDVEPERGQRGGDVCRDPGPAAASGVQGPHNGQLRLVRRRRHRRNRRRRRRRRQFLPLQLLLLLEPDPQRQRRGLAHALEQLLGQLAVLDAPSFVLVGRFRSGAIKASAAAAARGRRGDAAAEKVEVVAAVAAPAAFIKAATAAVVGVRDEEVDVC